MLILGSNPPQTIVEWENLPGAGTNSNIRGLCVVSDTVIWGSGSKGTFLRSVDEGGSWLYGTIPGAENLDFRDIHAVNHLLAWVISAGDSGLIFVTRDGGRNWYLQYKNKSEGIFFDGFAFWDKKSAIAYSDPLGDRWFSIRTNNAGGKWELIDPFAYPAMQEGEAGFAASGTGIVTYGKGHVWIASGGADIARVFRSLDWGSNWRVYNTPLRSGKTAGIFSMAFWNHTDGVIVGGDYIDSTNRSYNCAVTLDGGQHWELIEKDNPNGYRSCVAANEDGSVLLTVGRTGSEYSLDKGRTWIPLGTEGFYSCGIGKKWAFAVGRGGKVKRLNLTKLIQ